MIQLRIEESSASLALDTTQKRRSDFLRCLYDLTQGSETTPIYIEEIVQALHLEEEEAEATLQSLAENGLIKLRLQCIVYLTQAGIDEVKPTLGRPNTPQDTPPDTPPDDRPEKRPDTRPDTTPPDTRPNTSPSKAAAPVPAVQTAAQTDLTETPGLQLLGFLGANADTLSGDVQPLPARFVDPSSRDSEELVGLELKYLCEAIGLNPAEFTNERAAWDAFDADRQRASLHQPASAEMSFFHANDLPDILASLKLRLLKIRLAPDDMAEAEAEIATAISQLLSPRPKLQIIAASLNTLLSILEEAGTGRAGTAPLTSDIEMSLTRIRSFLKQLQV
jgi:hypothetical protein